MRKTKFAIFGGQARAGGSGLMVKKFSELRARMSESACLQADDKAQVMLAEMPLNTAMGGELELIARFPDGAVQISNLAELG